VNDDLADMKRRLRRAEELLLRNGSSSIIANVKLAQAISRMRRLIRHADRGRAPSTELLHAMQAVDALTAG
jgi:hypothetical protein